VNALVLLLLGNVTLIFTENKSERELKSRGHKTQEKREKKGLQVKSASKTETTKSFLWIKIKSYLGFNRENNCKSR